MQIILEKQAATSHRNRSKQSEQARHLAANPLHSSAITGIISLFMVTICDKQVQASSLSLLPMKRALICNELIFLVRIFLYPRLETFAILGGVLTQV